jgi:hypothetical protein
MNTRHQLDDTLKAVNDVLDSLSGLDRAQREDKMADVQEMIRYYATDTSIIEGRRTKLHEFGQQILTWCIAGLSILMALYARGVQNSSWRYIAMLGIIILSLQALVAMTAVGVYLIQSNYRYPFLSEHLKRAANQWKWFYYGNEHILSLPPSPFRDRRDDSAALDSYARGLLFYAQKYVEETPPTALAASITQAYLLQVHNYYKHRFYRQLAGIWTYWWIALIIILVGGLIVATVLA